MGISVLPLTVSELYMLLILCAKAGNGLTLVPRPVPDRAGQ